MKTKKSAIIIVVIAVIVLVAGAVFGFTYYKHHSQRQPEDTFNTFIYALNDNNVEDMLDCIEPTEAELIQLALDKIDEVTDSKLIATLVKYLPFLADFTEFDILPELHPDIISADTDTKNSTLKIKLDGKEEKLYYNVYMIKLDDKWYIQYAWKA
ncbi:MAG: hypothetical protein HDT23_09060 [Ruminococcus sp.]|nr:hypothetical protein [Ruminococcus sp.]